MAHAKKTYPDAALNKAVDRVRFNAPPVTHGRSCPAHLTAPVLRELRLDAIVRPVNPDRFIEVIETLEDILDAANKAEPDNHHFAAEDVSEVVADMVKAKTTSIEDRDERVREIEGKYDDLELANLATDKEHEIEIADHCKIIDELRKRVEIAEHLIGTSTEVAHQIAAKALDGEKSAVERNEYQTIANLKLIDERDALVIERDQLMAMITMMRAEKPMKKRGAKS